MNEITKHEQGMFCWIDLATTDTDEAKKFYMELFGWEVNDIPIGENQFYSKFHIGGKDVAALSALQEEQKAQNIPPHWLSYIAVNNADEIAGKVEDLGGKLIMPPFDAFDSGRMAVLQDPTGAVVSLWQAKEHIGVGLRLIPNTLAWNELLTNDTKKATDFYTALVGWTPNVQQMGPTEYTTFMVGEQMAGGMMAITEEMGPVPPNWSVYFAVEDCDATVEKAKSMGAQVLVPPLDIPTVGRFSTMHDPQGAVFSVIKFEMKE